MEELTTLDLSNLGLEVIPKYVYDKKDLVHIKMNHGNCIKVSERYKLIDDLQDLETIDGQDISNIRNGIQILTSIFKRRLQEMFLTKVASDIYCDPCDEKIRINKMVELAQNTIHAGPEVLKDFKDYKLEKLIRENYEVLVSDALELKLKKEEEEQENDTPGSRRRTRHANSFTPKKKKRLNSPTKHARPSSSSFRLRHLLQTHSKNNDPHDLKTKVWMCAFEPDINNPQKTTSVVATCGGDSICFIDCDTGTVLKKYKQPNEEFYCLCWTILKYRNELTNEEMMLTMLAVAGYGGDIKLINPHQLSCFEKVSYHKKPIDALQFHPIIQHWLFSGSEDRTIVLWDLGYPFSTDVRKAEKKLVLKGSTKSTVRQIVVVPHGKIVLGACDDGLYAWNVDYVNDDNEHVRSSTYRFQLPTKVSQAIDSTNILTNNMIAMKRLGEGVIQIIYSSSQFVKNDLQLAQTLKWRETNTPFLKFSYTPGADSLVAGDDEGTIWVYDLKELLDKCKQTDDDKEMNLDDLPKTYKTQKLRCENKFGQLFNNVCASSGLRHVVGASDTNVVAIWENTTKIEKEIDDEEEEDCDNEE